MKSLTVLLGIGLSATALLAQPSYTGASVTGQLILVRTVNMLQQAQFAPARALALGPTALEVKPDVPAKLPGPQVGARLLANSLALPVVPSLTVSSTFMGSGFNGLTHRDQRLSNGGNQFSIEPPNPSIAVGNGLVLEGVNNAIQVFSASGSPLLPQAVSSNQVFGLAPGINRTTNVRGPTLTDMRVFYDQGINRWFVLQRSQDSDSFGNPLNTSRLYIAVSQTADPTGTYNIYSMDTTNAANRGCPCLSDYPQIGADQYGFYVSANEYSTAFSQFVDVAILAISKTSLASGATLPSAYRVIVQNRGAGFEFTIHPATTPPGGSYFLASNGLEYFVSSVQSAGSALAVWALSNTGSLDSANSKLVLSEVITPTLSYVAPDVATQRPGPLPYGSTLHPPGLLAKIDGGDSRVQSVAYAGGRLYVTLATQVTDEVGHNFVGGAYVILSPTFRGVLSSFTLRQGYLRVSNNHLLRPAIAVNPQGQGAIVVTLVGPDYYPSAAFVAIDTFSTASILQIAAPGVSPEDGFTGYPDNGFSTTGIARWGDYSTAVANNDGSIWMVTEYIPNALRTDFANWGTFLIRYTK
jgi:hypothetical protein